MAKYFCILVAWSVLAAAAAAQALNPPLPPAVPQLQHLVGSELVNAADEKRPVSDLAGKIVGLYFSAHWCPPCRQFTPRLVETFNQWKQDGKAIEIVFVSGDRNAAAMKKYMAEAKMPWLAIPYGDPRIDKLFERFKVEGIPTLVILDETAKVLARDARNQVAELGTAAFDRWQPAKAAPTAK